ncbi:MAG: neutral/alkaline non-lysosomal ceramidase N-terminal domain-containing protein [Cyclobacteriaceae bacterium]|nr:neutral/alkaline non-lysosomal ceramidase N-terminal domain-containing protein [Cyclobacteriaceae bacterium]
MYPRIFISLLIVLFQINTVVAQSSQNISSEESHQNKFWKTGVAREVITPREYIWMSGFAAREKPAEGKLHDLWVKALAIEDAEGNKALFIATDIIGYSRELSLAVCDRIQKNHQLQRENIILSSSHTHCGPVVNKNLFGMYPPFSNEMKSQIAANLVFLEDQIVRCAAAALNDLAPSRIATGVGISRFAVNRRNNKENEVLYASDLEGPSDHSVPVIRVTDMEENLIAVVCGYACHATTLGLNQWSGDYPGYTQIDLEKSFPGVTALFFAGCGADQNAFPRMTVPLAQQYGNELAEAVKRVLLEPMKELTPVLNAEYNEIELSFSEPLSVAELKDIEASAPGWQQQWATDLLRKMDKGEELPEKYSFYPVQSWRLGDQILVALGGEVVVDYAHKIRQSWGNELFIAAYANDVMAYIPSVRVLEEGGYEGNTSMRAYGQPSTWAPEIEEKILSEIGRQVTLMKKFDSE